MNGWMNQGIESESVSESGWGWPPGGGRMVRGKEGKGVFARGLLGMAGMR